MLGALKTLISHMIGQSIKSTLRQAAAWGYYRSRMYKARHCGRVMILMYHRVLSERELEQQCVQPGMYVHHRVFEQQVRFLNDHHQILSFSDLLECWQQQTWSASDQYCVMTFDDGWLDNYRYAYPILDKCKIPATIFLPTAYIGTRQSFWPERLGYVLNEVYRELGPTEKKATVHSILKPYPRLRELLPSMMERYYNTRPCVDEVIEQCKALAEVELNALIQNLVTALKLRFPTKRMLLSWEEITEMSQRGISFGSHSVNHRLLTTLDPSEAWRELELSQRVLIEKNVNYVPVFAYPNGNYNPAIQDLVKRCGYQAAVTTRFGFEGETPQDMFGIRRISIHNDISSTIPLFALHLSGLLHTGGMD